MTFRLSDPVYDDMLSNWIQKCKDSFLEFAGFFLKSFKTHPLRTVTVLSVLFAPVTDRILKARAVRHLHDPVINKMEVGSRPNVTVQNCILELK